MRQGTPGDERADEAEDRRFGERTEVLCLTVPVLMRDVGRSDRDADGEERQQRGDQVGARVRRLRHEPKAVRGQPGCKLEHDQRDGRADRDERCSPLRVHAASETEEPAVAGSSSQELAMSPTNCSLTPFVPLSCQWWKRRDLSGELYSKLNLQPAYPCEHVKVPPGKNVEMNVAVSPMHAALHVAFGVNAPPETVPVR